MPQLIFWFFAAFAISVLAVLGYYVVLRPKRYWKNFRIAYAEPELFFGNFKDTIFGRRHICLILDDIYKSYPDEKFVGFFQMLTPQLLIKDPDLIGRILIRDFNNFHSRGVVIDENVDPLSAHLVNLAGPRWKMVRSKLTPAFSSGKLKLMFGLVEECVKDLEMHLDTLAENKELADVKEIMAKFTTDVIGRCAFGLDFNSLKDPESEYRKVGRDIFTSDWVSRIKNIVRLLNPRILHALRIKGLSNRINNFFVNLMDQTMDYRKKANIERTDFMQLMINIYNNEQKKLLEGNDAADTADGGKFTYNLLAANTFVFYIAGFETTASTLCYLLYELALNPHAQRKMRQEIQDELKKHNGQINYDALNEMKYMDMAISETLRKYDPAPMIGRAAEKAFSVPGVSKPIPAGTRVVIPIYSLHHDPKYYPQPDKFIPERFTEENIQARPPHTYLPFGDGPRICIGLRFAKLEMKACLASILPKYEFSTCPETVVPIRLKPRSILFTCDHEVFLKVSKI